MEMDDLYKDVILDHYKNPRGYGELDDPVVSVRDNNPSCGDAVTIQLSDEDGLEIGWTAESCAIATASASIMANRLQGATPEQVRDELEALREMLHEQTDGKELGNLKALRGVIKFPVRVKCALLAWETLDEALKQREREDS